MYQGPAAGLLAGRLYMSEAKYLASSGSALKFAWYACSLGYSAKNDGSPAFFAWTKTTTGELSDWRASGPEGQ